MNEMEMKMNKMHVNSKVFRALYVSWHMKGSNKHLPNEKRSLKDGQQAWVVTGVDSIILYI